MRKTYKGYTITALRKMTLTQLKDVLKATDRNTYNSISKMNHKCDFILAITSTYTR